MDARFAINDSQKYPLPPTDAADESTAKAIANPRPHTKLIKRTDAQRLDGYGSVALVGSLKEQIGVACREITDAQLGLIAEGAGIAAIRSSRNPSATGWNLNHTGKNLRGNGNVGPADPPSHIGPESGGGGNIVIATDKNAVGIDRTLTTHAAIKGNRESSSLQPALKQLLPKEGRVKT